MFTAIIFLRQMPGGVLIIQGRSAIESNLYNDDAQEKSLKAKAAARVSQRQ